VAHNDSMLSLSWEHCYCQRSRVQTPGYYPKNPPVLGAKPVEKKQQKNGTKLNSISRELLLQTAYRNSAMIYPMVPSPTPYDFPFPQITRSKRYRLLPNDFGPCYIICVFRMQAGNCGTTSQTISGKPTSTLNSLSSCSRVFLGGRGRVSMRHDIK